MGYIHKERIDEHDSDCDDCGEKKGYEAGSSNVVRICWNCGAGKEWDEDSESEEI